VPLAIVVIVSALVRALQLGRAALERGDRRVPSALTRHAAALGALAFVGLVLFVGRDAWAHRRRPHALVGVERTYDLINDAFSRGLPIVANVDPQRGSEPAHRARALHWATKGFVRDELLLVGKRLPDFSYLKGTVELDEKRRFIPPSLTPERARELIDDGCSVRLRVRGSNVDVSPSEHQLPARCGR